MHIIPCPEHLPDSSSTDTCFCRDKTLFWTHVAVACVLGVFCGGLYYQTGITIAGFQSRIGCLFFLVGLSKNFLSVILGRTNLRFGVGRTHRFLFSQCSIQRRGNPTPLPTRAI